MDPEPLDNLPAQEKRFTKRLVIIAIIFAICTLLLIDILYSFKNFEENFTIPSIETDTMTNQNDINTLTSAEIASTSDSGPHATETDDSVSSEFDNGMEIVRFETELHEKRYGVLGTSLDEKRTYLIEMPYEGFCCSPLYYYENDSNSGSSTDGKELQTIDKAGPLLQFKWPLSPSGKFLVISTYSDDALKLCTPGMNNLSPRSHNIVQMIDLNTGEVTELMSDAKDINYVIKGWDESRDQITFIKQDLPISDNEECADDGSDYIYEQEAIFSMEKKGIDDSELITFHDSEVGIEFSYPGAWGAVYVENESALPFESCKESFPNDPCNFRYYNLNGLVDRGGIIFTAGTQGHNEYPPGREPFWGDAAGSINIDYMDICKNDLRCTSVTNDAGIIFAKYHRPLIVDTPISDYVYHLYNPNSLYYGLVLSPMRVTNAGEDIEALFENTVVRTFKFIE